MSLLGRGERGGVPPYLSYRCRPPFVAWSEGSSFSTRPSEHSLSRRCPLSTASRSPTSPSIPSTRTSSMGEERAVAQTKLLSRRHLPAPGFGGIGRGRDQRSENPGPRGQGPAPPAAHPQDDPPGPERPPGRLDERLRHRHGPVLPRPPR